jgi:NADP-dependent 3-hydroxy acid dehydrogenase YdfG
MKVRNSNKSQGGLQFSTRSPKLRVRNRGLGERTIEIDKDGKASSSQVTAWKRTARRALVANFAPLRKPITLLPYERAGSAAVEAMVARTEAELGPVTILVNNAGVAWQGTLDTYDREQVERMRQVNVDGVIHATRAVMRSMRARRYGRIVRFSRGALPWSWASTESP